MTEDVMDPFALDLDLISGNLQPATTIVRRRLSDMTGMYADAEAQERMVASSDPLIYEVLQHDVPEENGQLIVCTTVIYPGRVGDEYFMTKGHYHEKREAAEIYLGLQGRGKLLLEVKGRSAAIDIGVGTLAYVPPCWSHRTVNTGDTRFVFLAVYPADAGHDYGTIERTGFARRVLAVDDKPVVAPAIGREP